MAIAASAEVPKLDPVRLALATLRGKIEVKGALLWGDLTVRTFRPKVIGAENIPVGQQVIFVFNHTTHPWKFFRRWQLFPDVSLVRHHGQKHNKLPLTIVTQYTRRPHDNRDVEKIRQRDEHPYRRARVVAADLVPIDPFRPDREFMPSARAAAEEGKSFAISGEGIHRPENTLQDPHTKGAAKLSTELQLPTIPVFRRDANSWRFFSRPTIVFGPPLTPPEPLEGRTTVSKPILDKYAGNITDELRRQQALAFAA